MLGIWGSMDQSKRYRERPASKVLGPYFRKAAPVLCGERFPKKSLGVWRRPYLKVLAAWTST